MRAHSFCTTLTLPLLLFALSCGGEGTADGSGGSSGETGGSTSSGGQTAAGGGDGTGGAASGGATAGGHCSPGFTTPGWSVYPEPIDNCAEPPNWTSAQEASFRDLSLTGPGFPGSVGPGQTYAFSADLASGGGRYEVYGASEKCAATAGALELLDSVEIGVGEIACFQVAPVSGTYEHLLWVWYGAGNQQDTTFCSEGTCPGR